VIGSVIHESTSLIRTTGLTKRFGNRVAVDDLAFEVERGTIYGFLGANGAGKTTTLRMLLGLIRPTAGEVVLFGEHLTPRRRDLLARIGAIVETPALYPDLTGRRQLTMLASLTGPCSRARIDEVLDRVGLLDRGDELVRVYSHGMRQRLAVAAALVSRPELVILDEPTNGLDAVGIRELRALIKSLADDDKLTIVLSSHLLGEVQQLCRRAIVIVGGRARWQGEVRDLLGARRRLRVIASPVEHARSVIGARAQIEGDVLWIDGVLDAATMVEKLVAAGVKVHEVTPWAPTLEEAFVDLVEDRLDPASVVQVEPRPRRLAR
jgi:ABC-2 type transport system ATP-binding protein